MSERLSRERLDELTDIFSDDKWAANCKLGQELLSHIAALKAEISDLLPMADVAGWWEGEFNIANAERNQLRKDRDYAALEYKREHALRLEIEAEAERLRETNKRLNRRCSKAEAIANKSIEQLRNEGQRNFGRMLANYAAAHYAREVERLQRVIVATPRDDGLVCWWCDQQVWTHADDESEPTYHPELHKEDCEYRLAEAALDEEVGE